MEKLLKYLDELDAEIIDATFQGHGFIHIHPGNTIQLDGEYTAQGLRAIANHLEGKPLDYGSNQD